MLAELFWPKEMKKLVKRYREEGTLNKKAVEYVNYSARKFFFTLFVIAVIMFFASGWKIALTILCLSPLAVYFDIYWMFLRQMAVYSYGAMQSATVKKFGIGFRGTQFVKYEIISNDESKITRAWIGDKPRLKKEDYPSVGQKVEIFSDPLGKYRPMPNVDYLKSNYSLTTTIL